MKKYMPIGTATERIEIGDLLMLDPSTGKVKKFRAEEIKEKCKHELMDLWNGASLIPPVTNCKNCGAILKAHWKAADESK